MLEVITISGKIFYWNGESLIKRIHFGLIGLNVNLSILEIKKELMRSVYNKIKIEDLEKTIILNAKSLIELDSDFSLFSARILLSFLYEKVLTWNINKDSIGKINLLHEKYFIKNVLKGVESKRLSEKLLELNLGKITQNLDYTADLDFEYLGIQTLYDRYLLTHTCNQKVIELLEVPQFFWMRISMGIFIKERKDKINKIINLYFMYKSKYFCSSTPTLFNSGTRHSQLSSCYLYYIPDSLTGIMYRGIAENALLSKWAGGLGGSWTQVRGTGSYIVGTNGKSQGIIPFLKLHNDQLLAVNQGGKRKGSGCVYLEIWHNDIFEFLELKKNTGDERRRAHDLNTALWIPDLFMKRMEKRQFWTLFRSNEVSDLHNLYGINFEKRYVYYEKLYKQGKIYGNIIPAIDLWKKMLYMIFETGHPWLTFKDTCNIYNPQKHIGVIHSSNLCTEITLNTNEEETAVCNLGSIVLENHLNLKTNKFNLKRLKHTISLSIRALDNIIDINFYPTRAAKISNKRHRPIGLGIMGWQNVLYKKGLSFDSRESILLNDEIMEIISYYVYNASSNLAYEKGKYSSFYGSNWNKNIFSKDILSFLAKCKNMKMSLSKNSNLNWMKLRKKIKNHGIRNSNMIAIAPTATISNIMGSTPCIEPMYKNLYVKSNLSGEFTILNKELINILKKNNQWNIKIFNNIKLYNGDISKIEGISSQIKAIFKTAFNIAYKYLIESAYRRQKWIDQSQSLNLFFNERKLKDVSYMYRYLWHKGLKTSYYLRTIGASNIEQVTVINEKKSLLNNNKPNMDIKDKIFCDINLCDSCQ